MQESNSWFRYYAMQREPNFDIEPLTTEESLRLFVGRVKTVNDLKLQADVTGRQRVLVTGDAGLGKTSTICKALCSEQCFIRIDASQKSHFNLVPYLIADRLTDACVAQDCEKAQQLRAECDVAIQRTRRVDSIVDRALELLHAKWNKLVLVLDEADADTLPGAERADVLAFIRALEMPKPSLFIWPVRMKEVSEMWQNPRSTERRTFTDRIDIPMLGEADAPEAAEILYTRLREVGIKQSQSVISEKLAGEIAILADGNIREYIRFSKDVLEHGAYKKMPLPIPSEFAFSVILMKYAELQLSSFERKVLNCLNDNVVALSASDGLLIEASGLQTSQLQENLNRMYAKRLINYKEAAHGKHLYSTTKKGLILLSASPP